MYVPVRFRMQPRTPMFCLLTPLSLDNHIVEDCSIEVMEDLNMIPSSLKVVAYVLFGVNVAVIFYCAGWLVRYRESDQVRASQPYFLMLVLAGCLISSSTIIALAQEDEGDGPVPACMAIPWLYSVGFSVTFGTLFAKIRRVYLIFSTNTTGTRYPSTSSTSNSDNKNSFTRSFATAMRSLFVSFQETCLVIGAVMLVDVSILTAWSVLDPLHWERIVVQEDQFGEPLESQGCCVSDSWVIFGSLIGTLHLCLMATACYLCYKAREIPTMFQEGRFVSIAMMSNLQIFVVGGELSYFWWLCHVSFFLLSSHLSSFCSLQFQFYLLWAPNHSPASLSAQLSFG